MLFSMNSLFPPLTTLPPPLTTLPPPPHNPSSPPHNPPSPPSQPFLAPLTTPPNLLHTKQIYTPSPQISLHHSYRSKPPCLFPQKTPLPPSPPTLHQHSSLNRSSSSSKKEWLWCCRYMDVSWKLMEHSCCNS